MERTRSQQKMKIIQNTLSRDWFIECQGKTYYVNFTASDGQTLALCNRGNWEVLTGDGEELGEYVMSGATAEDRKTAAGNAELKEQLVKFCTQNWDDGKLLEEFGATIRNKNVFEMLTIGGE